MRTIATESILEQMRVEKSARTVFTPLEDGTGVLLNVDNLLYYTINRTGVALWRQIETSEFSMVEDLVDRVCERFEIDRDSARRETSAFLERLKELKILRLV